jgi:hypothetical protein
MLLVLAAFSFVVQRYMRRLPAPEHPYTKLGCLARVKAQLAGARAAAPADGGLGEEDDETPAQAEAFDKAMQSWLMWQSLRARDVFVSLAVVAMFMIHSPTAKFAFRMFKCATTGDGVSHLEADMHIRCWGDEHYALIRGVAVPCLIVWVVGIPLTFFVLLHRNKTAIKTTVDQISHGKKLSQSMDEGRASQGSAAEAMEMIRMNARYSYLFKGYEVTHFNWELVVMLRKVALLAGVIFLANPESYVLQAWWVLVLVGSTLFLHMAYSPFVDTVQHIRDKDGYIVRTTTSPWLDYLERMSLMFSLVLFSCSQLLFMPDILVTNWVKVACTFTLATAFAVWPVVCWTYFATTTNKLPACFRERRCCLRLCPRIATTAMQASEEAHGVELAPIGSVSVDASSETPPARHA